MASTADLYRLNAERCEAKAELADAVHRISFLELAARWRKMAADYELRHLSQAVRDSQFEANEAKPVAAE
jgi:hypothetical protein